MTRKQTFLRMLLFLGCGSLLTLFSGFYSQPSEIMFLDVVPVEYGASRFGFPFPIYHSYAAWWGEEGTFDYSAGFVWEGALLDVIFYAIILWVGFRVAKVAAEARAVR